MSTGRPSITRPPIRPPTAPERSSTRTGTPATLSSRAQATPAIPAPTTTTVTQERYCE